MCKDVSFFPESKRVLINRKLYTLQELEDKLDRDHEEDEILHSLKEIILLKNINSVEVKFKHLKANSYDGMRGNGSLT